MTTDRWAIIAAGALVAKDVPDFALMVGVPAKRVGWVGKAGLPLKDNGSEWICPETGAGYVEEDGILRETGL